MGNSESSTSAGYPPQQTSNADPLGGLFNLFQDNSQTNDPAPKRCGVGINFYCGEKDVLIVDSLIPNGGADRTRRIQPGDALQRVKGSVVVGVPMDQVAAMLWGAEGSVVQLEFYRHGQGNFVVAVKRVAPEQAEWGPKFD
eukprot:CAMPEP_0196734306 /NCGR_PEP_ID=MMETSP1091-20130531/13083_1 /TAXON_ID=302021 /ORGANISM="Rhodomonas sp., Strain CCMP768" /LENGTH=140 /DNA_ID=CAMNT_0042077795 /DNA_START=74 /DNA_END=496 /DNA_ORIENTATION=-